MLRVTVGRGTLERALTDMLTKINNYFLMPALLGAVIGLGWLVLGKEPVTNGNGYADAVSRAIPAVVNIYSTKVLKRPPICDLRQFQELCDRLVGGQRAQQSLGSGVVLSEAGYIVTNEHVISGADDVLVAFHDGQATRAAIVGTDRETDLAVLHVDAAGLTTVPIVPSTDVTVGEIALAIGNPFGIGQTVSMGIVSAKGRGAISDSPYDDFIQTDAAINLGNSGGALINAAGSLIGINTLIYSQDDSEGLGFAIPADLAQRVMMEILETGTVTRGFLGAVLAPDDPAGEPQGLRVAAVEPGGPADRAGLLPGDIVHAVNDEPVENAAALVQQIAAITPGSTVRLNVARGSRTLTLIATAGRRPSS